MISTVLATAALSLVLGDPNVLPNTLHDGVIVKHTSETAGQRGQKYFGIPAKYRKKTVKGPTGTPMVDPRPKGAVACTPIDATEAPSCSRSIADPAPPAVAPAPAAVDVPGEVLREVRELGLPVLKIQVQPASRTLVNVETNFLTTPQPFNHHLSLLGTNIDITASPTTFTWHPGDGTSFTTSKPGRTYPHLDVTHRYTKPAKNVTPSVDVTYQVRYRVDGGPWQNLAQTLTTTGPAASIRVDEARPVITSD